MSMEEVLQNPDLLRLIFNFVLPPPTVSKLWEKVRSTTKFIVFAMKPLSVKTSRIFIGNLSLSELNDTKTLQSCIIAKLDFSSSIRRRMIGDFSGQIQFYKDRNMIKTEYVRNETVVKIYFIRW